MPPLSAIAGALLIGIGFLVAPAPHVRGSSGMPLSWEIATAARLAATSVSDARAWLDTRVDVRSVQTGADGRTLDVRFRDGRQIVILPKGTKVTRGVSGRAMFAPIGPATGQAIVLEPFGTLADGQAEVNALTGAGFAVTELAGEDVSIPVMEGLGAYNVVYIQTHSYAYPDGDAIILTGETNARPYASFLADHTMVQGLVAGNPNSLLYNAITGRFVSAHMGTFRAGSIVFLNGCETLQAPVLWSALQTRGVTSLIGWSGQPYTTDGSRVGPSVVSDLATGNTVAGVIWGATQSGDGIGGPSNTAKLGYLGLGDDTLTNALDGSLPPGAPSIGTAQNGSVACLIHRLWMCPI